MEPDVTLLVDTHREYNLTCCISVDSDLVDIAFARADGKPFNGGNDEFSLSVSLDEDLT